MIVISPLKKILKRSVQIQIVFHLSFENHLPFLARIAPSAVKIEGENLKLVLAE